MGFKQIQPNTEKLEDLFVIDETRGIAILDDIDLRTEKSKTSLSTEENRHKSVLEEPGFFQYDIKFFVHTEKCSNLGIDRVGINVHTVRPSTPVDNFVAVSGNPRIQINNVLAKKQSPKVGNPAAVDLVDSGNLLKNKQVMTSNSTSLSVNLQHESVPSSTIFSEVLNLGIRPAAKNATGIAADFGSDKINTPVFRNLDLSAATPSISSTGAFENAAVPPALNKNLTGPTIQTYRVNLHPIQNPNEKKELDESKVKSCGTSKPGFNNGAINKILQGVAGASNKDKIVRESQSESDVQIINTNLVITHGVHPASAIETFFPGQPRQDSFSKSPPSQNTRSGLKKSREPVKQGRMSELVIGKTPGADKVLPKTTARSESKDLSRSKGPLAKDIASLCDLSVSKNFDKIDVGPVITSEFKTKFLAVSKTISLDIQKSVSKEKLFFEVLLFSAGKTEASYRKIFVVNHGNQIRELTVPDVKPILKLAGQKTGKNTITVSQADSFASSIIIEKRTMRAHEHVPDEYKTVKTIQISSRDSPVTIDIPEENIHPNICIYRAIPVGPLGQRGHAFESLIAKGLPAPKAIRSGISKTYAFRAKNALSARNTTDGIRLTLSNFPPEAIAFYIIKSELGTQFSIDGRTAPLELNGQGGHIKMLKGARGGSVSVLDRKVYDGRTYSYKCVFKLPNARKVTGNSTEIIKFLRPVRQLPSDMNLKNLSINEDYKNSNTDDKITDNILVSFEIETFPTETGIEEITQLLIDSGVNDVFIDDLKKDRNRLSSFSFYEVVRTNLINGKKESFGITKGGIFKDSPELRNKLKISPIKPGDRFQYNVHLYLKSPESLFKGATTSLSESSSTALKNDVYETKTLSQKFALMYTKSNSLPSEQELLDKSPASLARQIMRGVTGYSKSIEVKLTPKSNSIANLSCDVSKLGYNSISWSITGDKKHIDHCIIYATVYDKKQPIGVVAPGSDNIETFFDKKFCNSVYPVSYNIELVHLDFSKSKNNLSASIARKQTMPLELIKLLTADRLDIGPVNLGANNAQIELSKRMQAAPRVNK